MLLSILSHLSDTSGARSGTVKRRILFVTYTKYDGGAEKHLADLIARLDLSIIAPTVLCYGDDFFTTILNRKLNLNVTICTEKLPTHFLTYWFTLVKFRPHIVVFVNAFPTFFPWYAHLAARLCGARRVSTIEHIIANAPPARIVGDGFVSRVRRAIGWRARSILRMKIRGLLTDRTICVSKAVRGRLVHDYGYPGGRTLAVWNGVDVIHYRPGNGALRVTRKELQISDDEIVLVYVGRLIGQKRVDILLSAIAKIRDEGARCRCIIVGDGPFEEELRKLSVDLGIGSAVLFVGYQEDVRPYLEMGDVFVLSSRQEGLPLALGEAMAHGLPCVATDVGGNGEIVVHGETGLIVPPGSAEELAGAVKYLIERGDERRRMGGNARKRVEECFNIEERMAELRAILLG
jgi:glycosyltransferase involved in cell wall biosynthesis